MYRILQNRLLKIQILILLLYSLVGCAVTNKGIDSTDFLKSRYNLQELCNGIEIVNHDIDFFYFPVYDLNNNEVKADCFTNNHKYQLIITCSPYLCGGCKRANIELANYFAKKYPCQVKFIAENWYIKDTLEGLENANLADNIEIYLDKNGRNIQRLKSINEKLSSAWYIIIDKHNYIRYLVAKSYYYQPDELQWGKIITKIEEYLEKG